MKSITNSVTYWRDQEAPAEQAIALSQNIQLDDKSLWNLFREGDEAAFIRIYKKYFHTLLSFGLQFCQSTNDVEDFVQDLFINLRHKRSKLNPLKTSLKVFLMVSLKNSILDYKRKQLVRNRNLSSYWEEFEFVLPVEEEMINIQAYEEKLAKLKKGLEQLSSRQREALYYLYFENLSYTEIKELMHLDQVKSVRNLVYKALDALKPTLHILAMVAIVKSL